MEPTPTPLPPPLSVYEVIVRIAGWLAPLPHSALYVYYRARLWLPTHQCVRGDGSVHTVYYCPSLGAYACHVCRADVAELPPWNGQTEPNMGVHASWNAMLVSIAQKYAYLWSLPAVAARRGI